MKTWVTTVRTSSGSPLDDEQVRVLARLEAADAIGDTEHLGGVDGQRLERFVAVHAPRDRHRGVIRDEPDVGAVAGRERDLDSGRASWPAS